MRAGPRVGVGAGVNRGRVVGSYPAFGTQTGTGFAAVVPDGAAAVWGRVAQDGAAAFSAAVRLVGSA